jgi:prevent-host-death family protein
MPRTVSATEAKNKLGSLIGWVADTRDEVIVESHGQPTAVLISVSAYEEMQALRAEARRARLLQRMRALRKESLARNPDLSPEAGDALAELAARDLVDDLIEEGKVRFEE